ncbi:Myotubularin-like phosphatase domain family protein [Leishmania donovani]|uniref:Myotubularin-like phosphatase domain family protein n=1 Tax=Leishmania donovani TaxID=5661 RepID=A0A504XNC0_LEIDO|nr:Myotubularin-like phosphatase domain family protein [Leishmania donovani]
MPCFPPFRTLEGEVLDLHVCSSIDAKDAVALLYFCGGDEKACVVQPCSLALSQYQLHIGPLGREACVEVPYMLIATWGIARASSSVTKAFVQVQQQAEETARTSSGTAAMGSTIGSGVASATSPSATAAVAMMTPLLSAPPAQVPQPVPLPSRPRYADPLPALYVVTLQTKHVWQHRLIVQSERLLKNIRAHLTLREFTRQLCVDASRPAPEVATEAALQEGRIGLHQDLRPWFRLVDLRDEERDVGRGERPADFQYTCSPTYPWLFLQPRLVDRELLLRAIAARSRARVPAVSYVCLRTGAVLARSSQPLMRSPQLSADSDVCYTLINMGYAPHHASPAAANSLKASPVVGAPATVARPVRPPSLFDDDSDGDGQPPCAGSTSNASSTQQLESTRVNGSGCTSVWAPPSTVSKAARKFTVTAAGDAANVATTPSMETSHSAVTGASTNSNAAKMLLVADCRPQITAAGNAQLGGGYESGSYYTFCQTNFFEIDNIFGVAKSFEKLRSMLARYQGNTVEKTFLRRLYDSDWLAIVQRVLVCSVTAAQSLQNGVSCLVHCTDGWDRTSQCTALAMLLLDPYYRTIVGFCTLIEKEFCSFGHKFAERSGHQLPGRTTVFTHSGVASSDTEQQHGGSAPRLDTSPIFLNFLDAVFQVCHQYPTCFEFTPELLAHLSEVVYSCLYGTFLCNGEQERRLEGVRLRTASVWTDVLRRTQREKAGEIPLCFVNVHYDAATAWRFISQRRRGRGDGGAGGATALADFMLLPNCSSKRLVFWEQLYTREDADHYLSYNPHVHAVKTTQEVSWGPEFDGFLDAEMEEACADRENEMASLLALEEFMAAEANTPAAPSLAANSARSAWCVFDAVNCFNCYKSFGMWSTKAQCAACKQYFCTDCHRYLLASPSSKRAFSRWKQYHRAFYTQAHNRGYVSRLRRQRRASTIRGSLFLRDGSPAPLAMCRWTAADRDALQRLAPSERSPMVEVLERLESQGHNKPSSPMACIRPNEPEHMPNLHHHVPSELAPACCARSRMPLQGHCEANEECDTVGGMLGSSAKATRRFVRAAEQEVVNAQLDNFERLHPAVSIFASQRDRRASGALSDSSLGILGALPAKHTGAKVQGSRARVDRLTVPPFCGAAVHGERSLLAEARQVQQAVTWLRECPSRTLQRLQQRVLCTAEVPFTQLIGMPLAARQPLTFSDFVSNFLLDSPTGAASPSRALPFSLVLLSGRPQPVAPLTSLHLVYGLHVVEEVLRRPGLSTSAPESARLPTVAVGLEDHQALLSEVVHWSTFFESVFDRAREGLCRDPLNLYAAVLLACAERGARELRNTADALAEEAVRMLKLSDAASGRRPDVCVACRTEAAHLADSCRSYVKRTVAAPQHAASHSGSSTKGRKSSASSRGTAPVARFFLATPAVVWWAAAFLRLYRLRAPVAAPRRAPAVKRVSGTSTTLFGDDAKKEAAAAPAAVDVVSSAEAYFIRDWIAQAARMDREGFIEQEDAGCLCIPLSCATHAPVAVLGFTQESVQAALDRMTAWVEAGVLANTPLRVDELLAALQDEYAVLPYYLSYFAGV